MGNTNSIPAVSQVKSLTQVCVGDAKGAKETKEAFSKQCIGVSQVRSLVESASGNNDAARRTQEEFVHGLEDMADGTPVVGHVKGVLHYAMGDNTKGDTCMKGATRTAVVIGAGVATGGAGFGVVAACAAGVAAGVTMDGVTTGIDSAVHKEYRPSGIIAAGHNAADSGSSGDIFDLMVTPGFDALTGVGGAKGLQKYQDAKVIKNMNGLVEPLPDGSVVTRIEGANGNVAHGTNSRGRQAMLRAGGYSIKKAKNTSKNMPMALRERNSNAPYPRSGGACAEHHAANKIIRVNDTPHRTYTVEKRNGKISSKPRCDNCAGYGGDMGKVVTDAKFPKLKAVVGGALLGLVDEEKSV